MNNTVKRLFSTLLLVALLLTLFTATALADDPVGRITTKKTKVYSDSALQNYAGTIPAWTCLITDGFGTNGYYKFSYKGHTVYCNAHDLDDDADDLGLYSSIGYASIAKGVRIYQRPSASSASIKAPEKMMVSVVARKKGWTLVRCNEGSEYDTFYFFVKNRNVKKMK